MPQSAAKKFCLFTLLLALFGVFADAAPPDERVERIKANLRFSSLFFQNPPNITNVDAIDFRGFPPSSVNCPAPGRARAYYDNVANQFKVIDSSCALIISGSGSGSVAWNTLLNPNGNSSPNFGGTTFTFSNGIWDSGTMDLRLPRAAGPTLTTDGQIRYDTSGTNLLFYGGFSSILGRFDSSTVLTDGSLVGISLAGSGQVKLVPAPSNSGSGTSVLQVTNTNVNIGDSVCVTDLGPPLEWDNCTPGIPINVQTGTTYTYDGTNDRGVAVVSGNAGAQTYTIPLLSETNETAANFFWFQLNKNTGTITVNATSPNTFDSTGTGSETIQEGENVSFLTDPDTGIIYPKFSPGRVTAAGPLAITRNPYGMQIGCPTCGTGSGNISGSLTSGKVPVASGANSIVDGSILDDLTHAARNDNGYDINSLGRFLWWIPNNPTTGTTLNKAVCDDGSNRGILCPSASSTTNNVLGSAVAANGAAPGTTGSTGVCTLGFCSYIMDNSATTGHFVQSSSTVDGDLHDVGTTVPTNGQSYWYVFSGNAGAGTAAIIRNITPSEQNAASISGGNGRNLQVQVNGTATTKNIKNLNSSTPAPGGGFLAATFATSASGNTDSIIAKVPIQGTDSNLLTAGTVSGTGVPLCTSANGGATTSGCPGAGVTSWSGDQVLHDNSSSTGAVTENLKLQSPNLVLAGPVSSGLSNVVQSVTGRCGPNVGACTGGTQLSVNINNVAVGHALIVIQKWSGSGVPTTSGDTFVAAKNSTAGYLNTDVYVVCSSTGGNKTITTATGSSNVPIIMHVYEVSGVKTTSCTDTSGDANAPGGDPTHVSVSTGGSVAQASEFVLLVASNGGAGPFPVFSNSFGPGYTQLNETLDGSDFQSYALTTGIGNTNTGLSGVQTGTATMSSSSGANLAGIIVTFKLDTPASSATPTFRALVTSDLPAPLNGTPIGSSFNVTPVTVNANTTSDQNLQALILPAGFFNSLGKTLRVWSAGVYSTPIASTATLTYKMKLCTVSGCGSGTVVTLASWTTSANPGNVTTNPWNADATLITQTTGASGALESHGNLVIDLGATAGVADSIFSDTNTATVGTIDLSQLLYLQVTVSFSAGSASNTCVQRQMSAPNLY